MNIFVQWGREAWAISDMLKTLYFGGELGHFSGFYRGWNVNRWYLYWKGIKLL